MAAGSVIVDLSEQQSASPLRSMSTKKYSRILMFSGDLSQAKEQFRWLFFDQELLSGASNRMTFAKPWGRSGFAVLDGLAVKAYGLKHRELAPLFRKAE